jgi:hypothetical protein
MAGQSDVSPHGWWSHLTVDAWYVVCVLVPLALAAGSPAWYLPVLGTERPSVDHVRGFLAVGWACWLVALVATQALARRYEVDRRERGQSDADAWDRIAVRLLAVSGGLGILVTLVLGGMAALSGA